MNNQVLPLIKEQIDIAFSTAFVGFKRELQTYELRSDPIGYVSTPYDIIRWNSNAEFPSQNTVAYLLHSKSKLSQYVEDKSNNGLTRMFVTMSMDGTPNFGSYKIQLHVRVSLHEIMNYIPVSISDCDIIQ